MSILVPYCILHTCVYNNIIAPYSRYTIWQQCILQTLWAALYDAPAVGSALLYRTCDKPMDRCGRHYLANCGTGYGRTARHNKIATLTREEAFIASGISSRRDETGLLPDTDNRPGDVYVTIDAGCNDPTFSSAAFDFTVMAPYLTTADSARSWLRAPRSPALRRTTLKSPTSLTS